MAVDIRDKTFLAHGDVAGLNFIRRSPPYVFRRHFRSGLRSHILELLEPEDVRREKEGTVVDGVRWFPRAVPRKMLRIFRSRFASREQALGEIRRVKLAEAHLGSEFVARSEEFLVAYDSPRGPDVVLCGLQEYVHGEPLDPWRPFPASPAAGRLPPEKDACAERRMREAADAFITAVKAMIRQAGLIPDLAGTRNLIVTPSGGLKLVDINNISGITFGADICMDDKGYPVCDKSVEALFLLETRLVGRAPDPADEVYAYFLTPGRLRRVAEIDRRFHQRQKAGGGGG